MDEVLKKLNEQLERYKKGPKFWSPGLQRLYEGRIEATEHAITIVHVYGDVAEQEVKK